MSGGGFIYPNKVDQLQFIEAMVRTRNLLPRIPRDVMYYIWKNCFLMDVFVRLKELQVEKFGEQVDEVTTKQCEKYRWLFQRIEFYQLLKQPHFFGIVGLYHCRNVKLACVVEWSGFRLKYGLSDSYYTIDMFDFLIERLTKANERIRKKLKLIV